MPLGYTEIRSSKHLESVINKSIEGKEVTHYLIVNEWDKVCNTFKESLPVETSKDVYVIDIFNVPNAMEVIRSCIKSVKETISTKSLSYSSQLPMMVILHKTFPRVVEYNGSIAAELRI